MKYEETRIGQLVEFDPKVYRSPYTPYYDRYAGHQFRIESFRMEDEHDQGLWLVCVSNPDLELDGYVWPDQLVLLS
jgi:hypothetical protein